MTVDIVMLLESVDDVVSRYSFPQIPVDLVLAYTVVEDCVKEVLCHNSVFQDVPE